MKRGRFYRVLVCSLIAVLVVCPANAAEKFDLRTFFENPFIGKEMFPDKFNSYAEFEKHFKNEPFVSSSEMLMNRYDETKQDNGIRGGCCFRSYARNKRNSGRYRDNTSIASAGGFQ